MTTTPPEPPSREGQVLDGRYRIEGLIGRGGMAEVYRGTDQTLGRPVAVKILTNAANAEAVDRHASEAQIGARLNHPGLVAVYDVSTDHDPPFLVMELVQGMTLADALERGPLAPIAVAEVGAQLMAALAVVHRNEVLHRDIKPSNVMVAEGDEPVVKLTDFGISRLIDSTRLTSTGLLVGTARYLSPEQAAGETVGPETDVYAAGLVLLECLTGVQAFPGTQVETLSARLHKQPDVPESLGQGWATVLGAMTQRDPAARPDAAEAARALRTLAEGGMPTLSPRPTGRAAGAAAAGAAGAAAGAAGAMAAAPTQAMGATPPDDAATRVAPGAAVPPAGPPTGAQPLPPPGDGREGGGKGKRNAAIVAAVVVAVLLVALGVWALTQNSGDAPTDEPTTSEPTTEEPSDEPTQDEPTQDEPSEEPTTEEPSEEPTTEEPSEEPTTEEPSEEPTTEEPSEEPTQDQPTDEQNSDQTGPGNGNGNGPGGGPGGGPGDAEQQGGPAASDDTAGGTTPFG